MRWLNLADEDRQILRFADWPEVDQINWDRAFGKRRHPRRASEGGRMPKPATLAKWRQGCGRFQGYLRGQGRLDPSLPLAQRVTEENLDGFFQHLLALGRADHTIVGYFNDLRTALERMYPDQSFKFITHSGGVPLRQRLDMTKRDITPPERDVLIQWAKDLYAEGLLLKGDQRRRVQIRDAVLFGILCDAGPRLRSVTEMRAGVNLQQRGEEWWLALEPENTKTGRALREPLSPWLWPMIERYLTVERIELLRSRSHDALWIDWVAGDPLDEGGVEKRVRWRSEKRFGKAFGPHMFRYSIATDEAAKPGGSPFGAARRLGHANPNTTTGYTHGAAVTAVAKRYAAVVGKARGLPEKPAEHGCEPEPPQAGSGGTRTAEQTRGNAKERRANKNLGQGLLLFE